MSVEVARTSIYPNGFDALDSSSGDTDEFIKSVQDSLQRGRYDTTSKIRASKYNGVIDSEDEQPSLSLDDEADIGNSLEQGGNSLTEVVEVPLSDEEDESKWLSSHLQNNLVTVKQSSAGVEDLVVNYPNNGMRDNYGATDDNKEMSDMREEKDLLSMVLDEIPDSMITPPLMSADIAHMSVRQKMLQELEDSRKSVLQMERVHQQEIAKLKEILECAKVERRNERSLLQQKITSLHKELENSKRKIKNMERDHSVLLERNKEAEQVAQKIEVDSIQNKMALESHEQDVNKIKMIHKAEMIKLQQMLKEREQELKSSNQMVHEERETLASVRFQVEECRRDNQIKLNKVKNELASKTEEFHRQMKKEKSIAVSKALEEANLQKSKELKELQLKCQDDKMAALNRMERKFTAQLQEVQKREQELKRDHVTTPTKEVGVSSKHLEKIFQDHSSEKVKQQQRVHQLEQELQLTKNEMKLIQQQQKEATHQHDKEKRAIAMEIMEECHKMSTLLMKRMRSGKSPTANCWAAIVQLKNTNEELANQIKELTIQVEQEKQSAVKVNRERLSEIRKLQKSSIQLRGKSSEEQRLEKQIAALKEKFMLLNKERLLLEGEVNKLRK